MGLLSVISICLSGFLNGVDVDILAMVIWVLAQASVFQFYDPAFLVGYGIGQTNGSLWTVFIEIQFYILIPLVYLGLTKLRIQTRMFNSTIFFMAVVFMGINRLYYSDYCASSSQCSGLLGTMFAPYFYMFLVGMLFQRYFNSLLAVFSGRFLHILGAYLVIAVFSKDYGYIKFGNSIDPLLFLALCCVVFSAAFSKKKFKPEFCTRMIFLGIYIYHMPVVNFFMYKGFISSPAFFFLTAMIVVVFAVLSWMM